MESSPHGSVLYPNGFRRHSFVPFRPRERIHGYPLNDLSRSCYQPEKISVGVQTTPILGSASSSAPSVPLTTPTRT